jgi:hypothetical protein
MFSKMWLKPQVYLLASFCVGCLALAGCTSSKGASGKVSGRVKYFDKYLTCGTVAFTSADGRVGTANIDADGNYEMAKAPVGEVTVTVQVPQSVKDPRAAAGAKPPPGVPDMHPPGEVG